LFLFAVIMLIVWIGLLLLTHYKVPVERRLVAMWIARGGLLLASGQLLVQIASQRHWTLHHSALGVAGLLLSVAGVVCSANAAVSAWSRTHRQRA
jgi:hypothetical protein